jgi:hypothetical protein
MNGRKDTTLRNGDTREELVQFFVVSDGELEVTRDDTGFWCGVWIGLACVRVGWRELRGRGRRDPLLLSLAALPANSRISALKYSNTAAR